MNSQNPDELSPSQLFEQDGAELANIFDEKKSSELPNKISRYQIIEELGRGGMGCVYKAYDPNMNQFIALKVILAGGKDQEKVVKRFLQEAKAMGQFSHPNIVRVYDVGKDGDNHFITMDYIEGQSLKDYLQNTPLNVRQFCQLMVKISKAMSYAHEKGIIHRDLKPANIMLDKNFEPQVMDFGLAKLNKVEKSLSKKGAIIGTPQYMSPEQGKGEKVNHLADVYALGAIFYEMLAGKPLIQGQTVAEIMYALINKKPDLLRQINKNLSRDLETICHKAVAKLEQRYQKAKEFSEDIERFLNGELIKARAASLWERFKNKLQRNKLVVIVAMVGFLMIAGVIWTSEKVQNVKANRYFVEAKKLQEKVEKQKTIEKQMQVHLKVSNLLEKALSISPNNFAVKKQLIETKEIMGKLAKEQKNYLLSFVLFKQCKNLGYKEADTLLNKLEEKEKQLEKKHEKFIIKAMEKMEKILPVVSKEKKELVDRHMDTYVFTIVKMQKPYVIGLLIPYLEKGNKWQRLLAIKTLGKSGNNYTKYKGKDSVEWLLGRLEKFKDKKTIENNQEELEEIIWALGWLKDKRANDLVHKIRVIVGQSSLFWDKTKLPYRWIPLDEKMFKQDPQQFIKRSAMKNEKGDYQGAIADLDKAIVLNPKDSSAYMNRGVVYYNLKEYHKAIADYGKAIALNPKDSNAYTNRGSVYSYLKEYHKAIADLDKAIALNPKDSNAYMTKGNAYRNLKEYRKAIADLNKAIALNPKSLAAHSSRANVYADLKEYRKAIADLDKAIALNPRESKAYNNRANVYADLKEHHKAIADLDKAIVLNPRESKAYYNRGKAYRNLKEYSKAIADHNKAIALNPKDSKAYINRANVYTDLKEHHKAIADYSKAIALNPKSSQAYANRANAYLNLKKYSKAIADLDKAIALNSKYSEAYFNRANVYKDLKKYNKAIADYSKAIALNPKDSSAYNNRGLVYKHLKEYNKAIADYSKAIAFDPKSSQAYNNRGNVYLNLKKYGKAIADYDKAIALNPKYSNAYNNRGNTYLDLKKHRKAIADYNKAIDLNPKYLLACYSRGTAYAHLKEYKKAIVDLDKAIYLNPKYLPAYNNRANIYAHLKKYRKAIADYNKAIDLNPKYSSAYKNRGIVKIQQSNLSGAAQDFKKCLELNPNDPQAAAMLNFIKKHGK